MSRVVELLCSRRVPQVAVLALMSIGFAGCSADMSTRLSQNSFSNPFASQPEATGSVPTARGRAPRASAICPPATAVSVVGLAAADLGAAVLSDRAAPACPEEGAGVASYSPPAHPPIETTGSVAPRSVAATHGSAQGGTTIIVGTSDTLETLSRRYNVSPAAILQANGYKGPRALSPGQQLIIPRPTAAVAAARAGRAGEQAGCRRQRGAVGSRRQSRRYAAQHRAPQSRAGGRTRQGQQPRTVGQAQARHEAHRARREDRGCGAGCAAGAVAAAQPAAAAGCRPRPRWPRRRPIRQQKARLAQATTNARGRQRLETPVKAAEATGALPTFRWPVRGKVITATAPRPTASPMTASTSRCPRARR